MHYLIGDLQGCCDALDRLLLQISFSPSRDTLHVLGDIVNRGPQSLATLQRLHGLGNAAMCLLGNHDLHLLAVAAGVRPQHAGDTLTDILDHPRREAWLDWLRHRPLATQAHGWLLVHAGVLPDWDAATTLALADELHALLTGPDLTGFLRVMYGNTPARWHAGLQGPDRWRLAINALTRLRFCSADGSMDFQHKESSANPPAGLLPWFEVPGRRSAGTPIAFGHWSTLGLVNRPDLLALDTGCVWGGALTAMRVDGGRRVLSQVHCPQARAPG